MSTNNNTCVNCGKGEESSDGLKACMACKLVKYCNRDCQIAHRPQHKKACKKRAAELYDEKLFNEPPPRDECPICMLPLPLDACQVVYQSCCGKDICYGCIYAMEETGSNNMRLCPFCKATPARSDEEEVVRLHKLMEKGNANAYNQLGGYYAEGIKGLSQDYTKANELYLKAGKLGCANAYYNVGISYYSGNGAEMNKKKAKHYWELAAMNGDIQARHNLGANEYNNDNYQRAFKHLLIAARAGYNLSLDAVKEGYTEGLVTKDEYANTLREYQKSQNEMKSDARDKAAAILNQQQAD